LIAKDTLCLPPEELAKSAAAIFRLDKKDFMKIAPVYETLKAKIEALNAEARSYSDQMFKSGDNRDIKIIRAFTQRHNDLVKAAMLEVKSRLSPAGWQSLCDYINKDFAPNVHSRPLR
jgi:hypothetical protein